MKFRKLAEYLDKLENTASRNEMVEILAEVFKETKPKEINKTTHLLLGQLAAAYEDIVFNIAEKMMVRVLSEAYGVDKKKASSLYKKKGDLGDVAAKLGSKKSKSKISKSKQLSVTEVYDKLYRIAEDEGEGSQDRKIKKTAELLSELDPLSARFVARIPVGKLRLGFSDKTILEALSWMERGDKSAKEALEKAYFVLPDVGKLAKEVKEKGVEKATKDTKPQVGVPILPMLAQRLKTPKDMIKKMKKVAIESKLDGLRIQLHYKKGGIMAASSGEVKAYTRNLNETSWMFPELQDMGKYVKAKRIVLDTEAVGLDETRKKVANFQQTMTRRRKHEIEKTSQKTPIKFYVFDILLKDNKNLMNKSYLERREVLEKVVKDGELFKVVDYTTTKDPEVIEKEDSERLDEGLEGILLKKVNSKYVPGRTGWRWVKMKEKVGSEGKLADTVDCIVMGYTRGRGKRAEFGIGQFLAGVRVGDRVKTITKVGTGLTDEQFKEMKKRLKKIEASKKPKGYLVDKDLEPDFWVEPEVVVELAADEVTKSPKHTSGLALRFPRLVKFRDDKNAKQATTLKELKKLYKLQNS